MVVRNMGPRGLGLLALVLLQKVTVAAGRLRVGIVAALLRQLVSGVVLAISASLRHRSGKMGHGRIGWR